MIQPGYNANQRLESKLKVLVNATTLTKGGGLQVAASFINEALGDNSNSIRWFFAVSPQVGAEIEGSSDFCEVFDASPAKCKQARSRLLELECKHNPDVVFTIFGPAYVKFTKPHLSGLANGWLTHSDWQAFRQLGSPVQILIAFCRLAYKAWWARHADYWVVEAEVARQGLKRRLGISNDRVAVISNTCSRVFRELPREPVGLPGKGEKLRIVYLTSFYKHKNIGIIPFVAAKLEEFQPSLKFEFVVTLPRDENDWTRLEAAARALGVADRLINVGPVSNVEAPILYKECHIAFMPSLLETFSANYPEAMAMGCPLVASNREFAKNCCGDAASYFDAESAISAARTVIDLISDESRWYEQIDAGFKFLDALPDSGQRYTEYLRLISDLAKDDLRA